MNHSEVTRAAIDHADAIRIGSGGTIAGVLTLGDINQVLGLLVALTTIVYLAGCIHRKRLEVKLTTLSIEREGLEVERLRDKMEREAERILAEKLNRGGTATSERGTGQGPALQEGEV